MGKPIRRHNRGYSGGFPLSVGDRYYAQDIFRDSAYLEGAIGITYNDLCQQSAPYILSGLVCAQGAGHTMDITAGKAVVPFQVTIPDTVAVWTVPPSTTTANIDMVLDYAGATGVSLAGTTTDGATPNYVKLSYTETNGNTRNRAKKAGSYAYEVYDTVTVTINAVAPTAYEVTALTFTTDGATVTITNNGDTRIGSPFHMQDAVVYDQTSFNNIIRRVAANQYKIRDDITSVYMATLSGGYLMYGGTSPLSGGDTWGYIETNNCTQIIFEEGAYLHFGNTQGYIEVDTDDCCLKNVDIQGTGTVASAIAQSFLLNANRVQYIGCSTDTRLSNTTFIGFKGSGTATHNDSTRYVNCNVLNHTSSGDCYGFYNIQNGINLIVDNIESTANAGYGFSGCAYISNSKSTTIDASAQSRGFSACTRIASCYAYDIDSSGNYASGFNNCEDSSDCYAYDIDSAAGNGYGFYLCETLSSCHANKIDHSGAVAGIDAYGFYGCNRISSCHAEDIDTNGAGGDADGFNACDEIAASYATTCNNGFNDCESVASSYAYNNSNHGFNACPFLTACKSYNNTVDGFNTCNQLSVCDARSNGGDGYDNCDRVGNSFATTNTGQGFLNCNQINNNRSTANTAGQYSNSFADFGATQATADTAAGGYNA